MSPNRGASVVLLCAFTTGCVDIAPPELVSARAAYERVSHSPTAQQNPADLITAQKALTDAEKHFVLAGDDQDTRDLAYAAERNAQIAESHTRTLQIDKQTEATVERMHADQKASVQRTAAELARVKALLAAQTQELALEKKKCEEAESRSKRR